MARSRSRIQSCGTVEARQRFADAVNFLTVAELAADENDPDVEYGSVAASLAVLAGVAATDAACCFALGERSRSQNHHDAESLLAEIAGGKSESKRLRQLITLKDAAHYGLIPVTRTELKTALRSATGLVEFARTVIRG